MDLSHSTALPRQTSAEIIRALAPEELSSFDSQIAIIGSLNSEPLVHLSDYVLTKLYKHTGHRESGHIYFPFI